MFYDILSQFSAITPITYKKITSNISELFVGNHLNTFNNIFKQEFKNLNDIYSLIIAYSQKENCIYLFDTVEEANEKGFYESSRNPYFQTTLFKYSKTNGVFKEYDPKRYVDNLDPIVMGKKSPSFITTGGLRYTFGVEIETIRGLLPYYVYHQNNLSLNCVRDGSLRDEDGVERGGEYVTGVLQGDAGMLNLKKSMAEISKRCSIDQRCGIHVHVGGCNFSPQFSVLAYILALKLEDEIFQTLPPSRRDNDTCGRLFQEDYLKIIKKYNLGHGVEICFEDLFKKMSNGRKVGARMNRRFSHPGGRYTDRYARNIAPRDLYRYKWLNFIAANFNMKGNDERPVYTLEFRSHPASLNFDKVSKWINFCLAFCYYVENNINDIINKDNITINDVLTFAFGKKPEQNKVLCEYFDNRKLTFALTDANKYEIKEYKQETSKHTSSFKRFVNDTIK